MANVGDVKKKKKREREREREREGGREEEEEEEEEEGVREGGEVRGGEEGWGAGKTLKG